MADKRTRRAPVVPFVDAAKPMAEAMLTPVTSGFVPDADVLPLPREFTETAAVSFAPAVPTEAASAPVEPATAPEEVVAEAAAPTPLAPVSEPEPEPMAPNVAPEPVTHEMPKAATLSPANPFLKGLLTMATAPETTYAAADRFQSMFGDVNERAKSAVEKSTKMAEEFSELTKGNVEAIVASGRVAAKGAEAMTQEAAEYSKKSFESATATFKSFAAVKSPTELFQLQSEYAKSSFEAMVAEASKVSESMLKLMGEIAQPISNRYAVAAEKFKAAAL